MRAVCTTHVRFPRLHDLVDPHGLRIWHWGSNTYLGPLGDTLLQRWISSGHVHFSESQLLPIRYGQSCGMGNGLLLPPSLQVGRAHIRRWWPASMCTFGTWLDSSKLRHIYLGCSLMGPEHVSEDEYKLSLCMFDKYYFRKYQKTKLRNSRYSQTPIHISHPYLQSKLHLIPRRRKTNNPTPMHLRITIPSQCIYHPPVRDPILS